MFAEVPQRSGSWHLVHQPHNFIDLGSKNHSIGSHYQPHASHRRFFDSSLAGNILLYENISISSLSNFLRFLRSILMGKSRKLPS